MTYDLSRLYYAAAKAAVDAKTGSEHANAVAWLLAADCLIMVTHGQSMEAQEKGERDSGHRILDSRGAACAAYILRDLCDLHGGMVHTLRAKEAVHPDPAPE